MNHTTLRKKLLSITNTLKDAHEITILLVACDILKRTKQTKKKKRKRKRNRRLCMDIIQYQNN